MKGEELEKVFKQAYETASKTKVKLPQDIMLKLYAYYKHATNKSLNFANQDNVKDAFKLNARLQISAITVEEAKIAYIEIVNQNIRNHE